MGQIAIRESTTPSTPTEGVVLYPSVATPSLLKFVDDSGNNNTVAALEKAQSFTATQTFAPTSTSVAAVAVNAPASCSTPIHTWLYNSTRRAYVVSTSSAANIGLDTGDFGNTVVGPSVVIGGNNNATNACSGTLTMYDRAGTARYMWPDQSSNFRIHTVAPTNFTTDTNGTVVGTQTSALSAKNIFDGLSRVDEVLGRIRLGAQAVRRFDYISGSFNQQVFEGVVIDYAPEYGMDRDAEHPAGKSLNEINIAGDLLRAMEWAIDKIATLEARIVALGG